MTPSLTVRPLAADILAECGYSRPKQNVQAAPVSASTSASGATTRCAPAPVSSSQQSFTLPALKACTAEETSFRAYFLAMAVINNHKMMLSALAERFNLQVESAQVQGKINCAVKILASASLFLIGLESGGINNDKASMELLFAALRVVEKLSAGCTVKELVSMYGNCQSRELSKTLCRLVVQTLELNPQVESKIEEFVCSQFVFRKEVSCYACRQEVSALRDQVVLFQ